MKIGIRGKSRAHMARRRLPVCSTILQLAGTRRQTFSQQFDIGGVHVVCVVFFFIIMSDVCV